MKYLGLPQSGSLADRTYSRNTFGQYARARVGRGGTPDQPITPAVEAWQALAPAQQLAWNEFAATQTRSDSLGSKYSSTGFNRFVSAWLAFTAVGRTPMSDPPEAAGTSVYSVTVTLVSGTLDVAWSPGSAASSVILDVAWPVPVSSGAIFAPARGHYWKRVGVAAADVGIVSYSAGTSSGQWCQFRVREVTPDGRIMRIAQGRIQDSAPSAPLEAFTAVPGGSRTTIAIDDEYGMVFQLSSPISVTEIGVCGIPTALTGVLPVKLYDSGMAVLASVLVPIGTSDQYYWQSTSSPIPLSTGVDYYLLAFLSSFHISSADVYYPASPPQSSEWASAISSQLAWNAGSPGVTQGQCTVPVNLRFTV